MFDISIFNKVGYTDLPTFILYVLNWVIGFAVILTVIMVVVAGFRFIFSMGDSKKIEGATKTLLISVIGLVVVYLAPAVIKFVLANFLGGL